MLSSCSWSFLLLFFLAILCRYKIYAEGFAWSVSLKYILSCGSLSLIISPQYEDFFSRGLIPKKNYWPVSPTNLCPSIKFAVDWGNAHPSKVFFYLILFQYIMSLLVGQFAAIKYWHFYIWIVWEFLYVWILSESGFMLPSRLSMSVWLNFTSSPFKF